jgi:hypothetical protein
VRRVVHFLTVEAEAGVPKLHESSVTIGASAVLA